MSHWLAIFVGGGLGSVLRYGVSIFVLSRFSHTLPIATITSNVLASALLAFSFLFFDRSNMAVEWKLFVMVGVCGGFSTFSTFSMETVMLIKDGLWPWALGNILLSVGVCVGCIWLMVR